MEISKKKTIEGEPSIGSYGLKIGKRKLKTKLLLNFKFLIYQKIKKKNLIIKSKSRILKESIKKSNRRRNRNQISSQKSKKLLIKSIIKITIFIKVWEHIKKSKKISSLSPKPSNKKLINIEIKLVPLTAKLTKLKKKLFRENFGPKKKSQILSPKKKIS